MFGNSLRFNSMAVLRQILADDDSWINMNHNRRPHVKFNHLIYHLIYTSFNSNTVKMFSDISSCPVERLSVPIRLQRS